MSTYKKLLSSDIIISPFEVNKSFNFTGNSELIADNVKIDRFVGLNTEETTFTPAGWAKTGKISGEEQYKYLVYSSIKDLYYSNFIATYSSSGSADSEYGRFYNYPQSDLTFDRYFPTENLVTIGVISIPSKLYGEKIKPGSLILTSASVDLTDDGEGNLYYGGNICGNIFYNQGLVVITSNGQPGNLGGALYGEAVYGTDTYGGTLEAGLPGNFATNDNITVKFSSSFHIYETQYKCTIDSSEFNYSLNPSLITSYGQNDVLNKGASTYKSFVSENDFSPFVTTIGLYNEDQELVAVGKLSQPLPTSQTTDTTIFINIDR